MQNSWIRELSVDYLAVMPAGHEQPDEVFSSVVCDTVEHIGSVGIISCRQFPVIRVGPRRRNVGSGEMSGTFSVTKLLPPRLASKVPAP